MLAIYLRNTVCDHGLNKLMNMILEIVIHTGMENRYDAKTKEKHNYRSSSNHNNNDK